MSHNKFVASALVALLLGTSVPLSTAQSGGAEPYFYPKNKWVVSRVNSDQEPHGICTVRNQLNNGYVLELSGGEQGISNINIDFRQNAFQKNLKYEVQYTIPGVSRAIIPSRASQQSLIVSDLSGKQDFAKKLASAGVLDVQIRDNSFRIYLTGLKASMPQFEDCVSPMQFMAQDETNAPASKNILVEDTMEIIPEPEFTLLEGNLAPPPPMPMETVSVEPIITEESVAEENIISDPRELRPKPSNRPRYTELMAEKLKQKNEKYKPVQDSARGAKPKVPTQGILDTTDETRVIPEYPIKPKITNVKSPKPVYHITRNEEPVIVDLTKEARMLSDIEPAAGQMQPSVINEDFVAMRNKISEMEKELISVRENNKMLDEELKITLQDSEKERVSVSSGNWNLERATMKFNEAESQIMRLGRQLQTQRAVCEKEKSGLENMLFDPKLTDQNQLAKLSMLERELDESKYDLYRQKRLYEERIELLKQQLKAP